MVRCCPANLPGLSSACAPRGWPRPGNKTMSGWGWVVPFARPSFSRIAPSADLFEGAISMHGDAINAIFTCEGTPVFAKTKAAPQFSLLIHCELWFTPPVFSLRPRALYAFKLAFFTDGIFELSECREHRQRKFSSRGVCIEPLLKDH
jgi:hypothetical protein